MWSHGMDYEMLFSSPLTLNVIFCTISELEIKSIFDQKVVFFKMIEQHLHYLEATPPKTTNDGFDTTHHGWHRLQILIIFLNGF
jgi:hypothetical protein